MVSGEDVSSSFSTGGAIYVAVKPIVKIYLVIGLGFLLGKKNILTPAGQAAIGQMILRIFIPCLIFYNIVNEIKDTDIKILAIILLTGTLYYVIGLVFALLLRYTLPTPRGWFGGLILATVFGNTSDLPVAYVQTLGKAQQIPAGQGGRGVAYVQLFLVIFVLGVYNMGGTRLVEWDFTRYTPRRNEVTNPPLLHIGTYLKKFKRGQEDNQQEKSASPSCKEEDTESAASGDPYQGISQQVSQMLEEEERDLSVFGQFLKRWRSVREKNVYTRMIFHFIEDIGQPQTLALIAALTCCMIPWVKRLFRNDPDQVIKGWHDPPDGNPPLDFLMDFFSFLANAQVPLGILVLGATMSRLKVQRMPPGFWKTAVAISIFKLAVLPIIACAWIYRLQQLHWISRDDVILPAVMAVNGGVPTATMQIYLTTAFTKDSPYSLEMDSLAIVLIAQYCFLPVSMSVLMTYVIKNLL